MADFDNGLPPANADLTGKKVSDVSIDSKEYNDTKQTQGVHDISIQQKEFKAFSTASITCINYGAKKVEGDNTLLFYL